MARDGFGVARLIRMLERYEVNPGTASACIKVLCLPNHRRSSRINGFIEFLEEILVTRASPRFGKDSVARPVAVRPVGVHLESGSHSWKQGGCYD